MEEPQEPGVGVAFSFPPHRRSHLKGGTHRNLVRLISLCYGDSPFAAAPPIIHLPRTPDKSDPACSNNGGNGHEPGGDDVIEPGKLIVSASWDPSYMAVREGNIVNGGYEGAVFQVKEFNATQMVIYELSR